MMREGRQSIFRDQKSLYISKARGYLLLGAMLLTQCALYFSLHEIVGPREVSARGQISFNIAELCFLTVDIYLVVWVFRSNRRRRDVEEYQKVRYELEQERIRYAELNEGREYLARIRHDYNNQLDTIRYLMEHNPEAALEMTESLLRAVREEEDSVGGEDGGSSDL